MSTLLAFTPCVFYARKSNKISRAMCVTPAYGRYEALRTHLSHGAGLIVLETRRIGLNRVRLLAHAPILALRAL